MSAPDYDAIAEAVSPAQLARILGAKAVGNAWRCPLAHEHKHEDRNPSFSLFRDGTRTAGKCHGCGLGGSPVSLASAVWGVPQPEAAERLVRELGIHTAGNGNGRPEILAEYGYCDESGELLYQVVRLHPKSFRQRRPDGAGGWTWRLGDTRRVPYRLPQILEAVALDKLVHIVEGEKDVHAVEAAGGVATTCPGGSGKWRPEYSEHFRGARVRVVADRDEPGEEHARQVAEALEGIAASVEIVRSREGKDSSDHLSKGYGLDDFLPDDPPAPGISTFPAPVSIRELLATEDPEESYQYEDLVENDSNVLLVAAPKSHKTNLLLHLGVTGAGHRSCLGAFRVPDPLRVGMVLMEDRRHRVKRRVVRMAESEGIDPATLDGRLHFWFRPPLKLGDAATLRELGDYVERLDLDTLWIDSYSYVSVGDSNKADEVTPQLVGLSSLRDRRPGLTVGLVVHARKPQEGKGDRITDVIRGSGAFGAWHDTAILLTRKDESAPVSVRVEHRDLPSPEPFAFTVTDEHDTTPPSGYLRLRKSERTAEELLREQHGLRLAPALLERLREHPGGVSRRELRELVEAPRRDVEAAFEVLRRQGEATYTPPVGKGRPARYSAAVQGGK